MRPTAVGAFISQSMVELAGPHLFALQHTTICDRPRRRVHSIIARDFRPDAEQTRNATAAKRPRDRYRGPRAMTRSEACRMHVEHRVNAARCAIRTPSQAIERVS